MKENGLIRKIRLISEFMTSQPGKQTIAIHILLNISKSKGNPVFSLIFIEANKIFLWRVRVRESQQKIKR